MSRNLVGLLIVVGVLLPTDLRGDEEKAASFRFTDAEHKKLRKLERKAKEKKGIFRLRSDDWTIETPRNGRIAAELSLYLEMFEKSFFDVVDEKRRFVTQPSERYLQSRHVVADDAQKDVVVDAEVGVNQAVTRGDDLPTGDVRRRVTHGLGNAGGCFLDELEVAQGRIVGDRASLETRLVQALGVLEHPVDETEHVIDVEPPLTSRGRFRHAPPPARRGAAVPRAMPSR